MATHRVDQIYVEAVISSEMAVPVRVDQFYIEAVVAEDPCVPPSNTDPTTAVELACPSGTLEGDACGSDNGVWFRFDPVVPTSITFTVVYSNGQSYLMGETASETLFDGVTDAEYTFEITETTWVQIYTDVPGPYSIAWACSSSCTPPANDNWANAQVLVGNSGSVSGTTACSTFEVDEPAASSPGPGEDNTVWYTWTAPENGTWAISVDPGGDPYGTWVYWDVYTGNSLATLYGPIAGGNTYLAHLTSFPVMSGDTYSLRISNSRDQGTGDLGPFTLSWEFVASPPPPIKAKQGAGRLGCGELTAFITGQCGAPRLCQLTDASHIEWNRRLDEISDALVRVPTGGSSESECCECLAEIEPWCHELHIFRNGVYVWGGPVTKVTYGYEEVVIDAKDLLAWTLFRVSEFTIDYSVVGDDIANIAERILAFAFAEHDPCVFENIQKRPTDFPDINLLPMPCYEQTAFEQLTEIADLIDFTVLGRSIILGGQGFPSKPIGILTDEMILGEIEVTKNGMSAGNRYFTRFEGDDTVPICAPEVDITCSGCTCKCPAISPSDPAQDSGPCTCIDDSLVVSEGTDARFRVLPPDTTADGFNNWSTTSTYSGGTYTLSYGGFTTAPLAWNADSSTVFGAVEGLPSIGPGDIQVSSAGGGSVPGLWEYLFTNALGSQPITGFTVDSSGITGPDTPYIFTMTTLIVGVPGVAGSGVDHCFSPIERLLDVGQPANVTTAQQFGDAALAATRISPRTIDFNDGTRISPEAPWDVNDMVPGQRIDVALTGLCLPVFQSFRLIEMTSTQDGLGEEEVTVSLELVVPAADE